jgi:hypothetical protein
VLAVIVGGFLILALVGVLGLGHYGKLAKEHPELLDKYRPKPTAKEQAMHLVGIEDWKWQKSEVSTFTADFTITNNSPFAIRDIEITCTHSGNSGTKIDSNTRTIYEVIPAGATGQFNKVEMGFIHPQATSSRASIENFEIVTP